MSNEPPATTRESVVRIMLQYLASGTILGLSAGMAPGPILALVITETLKYSIKEGIKVSMVPLITDFPIIVFSLFLVGQVAQFEPLLGGISIAGFLFVMYLAYESFQTTEATIYPREGAPKSMQKGILANLLNPHPYLFWITVGAPIILKATDISSLAAAAFVGSFYVLLVGSKILLAIIVGKYKTFLSGRIYRYLMGFLGLALGVLALFLLYDGLTLLGLL